MRPFLLAAAVLMLALPSAAQERRVPLPAVPKGVPSIMVEPDGPAPRRGKRIATEAKAKQPERKAGSPTAKPSSRTARRAPLPVPRTGSAGVAVINRSLEVQGQQMRAQDQRQFELNQIRAGSGGSLSCAPGSLGC